MSSIKNDLPPAVPAPSAALLAWVDGEVERITAIIPDLDRAALRSAEELAEADVIRRHVILHPERFSPHERDTVVERAQTIGEARQKAEVAASSARERLQFIEVVARALRTAQVEAEPAAEPPRPGGALAIFQAIESERLRIARELHDGPAQVLADLVLKAEIVERIAQRNPEGLVAELEEFRSLVRNAVADMRRFMFDLRPDSLDDLGLVATMKRFASEYQDRTGITCRFNVSGEERRVDPLLEEASFRIIQEAMNNVQKHAGAKTVEVTIGFQPGRLLVKIRDDGSGFDVDAVPVDGRRRLGLIGMKERAEALRGTFEMRTQPGSGTEIEVAVDLE